MSVDWKNPFKPEDIPFTCICGNESVDVARWFNTRFRELLSQAPVVYGKLIQDYIGHTWAFRIYHPDDYQTHQARLICIEPISIFNQENFDDKN